MNAIERARVAYEELMQRQRKSAQIRQARDQRRKFRVLVALGSLFVLLFGVVVYNGWWPDTLRSMLAGERANYDNTRTGQVRTMVQGNTCQELRFSNDSGSFVSGNLVSCEATAPTKQSLPNTSAGSRVNSIRDAFTQR